MNDDNCGIRNYVYNRGDFMNRNEQAWSISRVAVPDEKSRCCIGVVATYSMGHSYLCNNDVVMNFDWKIHEGNCALLRHSGWACGDGLDSRWAGIGARI